MFIRFTDNSNRISEKDFQAAATKVGTLITTKQAGSQVIVMCSGSARRPRDMARATARINSVPLFSKMRAEGNALEVEFNDDNNRL